ncbi:glycosyltransferase family 2 protein [Paraclostridium tenue]|uniref:Glycosyltransferase family 2 protein n=1 Tax=Paraclostridium tenue TaxID=1737 RepID=A0ABN1MA03_9FIRM
MKVSIITPVYNSEKFIRETIVSVLNQTYNNWEMIFIDDCSNDSSESIIKEYLNKDNRFKYIKLKKNSGVANARNIGIREAKGRFIAFLDSDDIWHKNKLETQVNYMINNNVSFCFSAYEVIDENSKIINQKIIPSKKIISYKDILKQNVIGCLTVVIDRNSITDLEMPKIRHEDFATWIKILKSGQKAYCIDEVLASYRKTQKSLSGNKIKSALWTWDIYRKYEKISVPKSLFYFSNYAIKSLLK